MKTLRKLSVTLFLICLAGIVTAQDVIVMKDQSTIMSKVLEITSTEIKYKKWNSQDGPTYSIGKSEVLSINYENGEVETFSNNESSPTNAYQQPTLKADAGFMAAYGGSTLKLNGRKLSDEEVRNLVDPQSYQLYLKGKKESNWGGVCLVASISAAIGAGVLFGLKKTGGGIALTVFDIATWVGYLVLDGTEEMKQVASEYNRQHGNYYSFHISPSLMNLEAPQVSNNCGLGMTISMNF